MTQLFAVEMARYTGRRTLVILLNAANARRRRLHEMPWNCHPTNVENLWMLPANRRVA